MNFIIENMLPLSIGFFTGIGFSLAFKILVTFFNFSKSNVVTATGENSKAAGRDIN